MAGASRTLPVPYFTQPTGNTCQSTVLKMMSAYLEQNVVFQSTGAGGRMILDIWKDINQDPKRPVKVQNAHANMKWWLEQHFPGLKFEYTQTTREDRALEAIVGFINGGFPVLVSVSHERVAGHIILVVGYVNYTPGISSADFGLVVHDPYGRFDPSLLSTVFGAKRYTGGVSLMTGSEVGAGRSNLVPLPAASRRRVGDAQSGTYYLLSASRR
jgi:hypothetical protein